MVDPPAYRALGCQSSAFVRRQVVRGSSYCRDWLMSRIIVDRGRQLAIGRSRRIPLRRRLGCFEKLESRMLLAASSIEGRPYIDLGRSDNVALDQPRVSVELISNGQSVGPGVYNTWLLDTGANSILTFRNAVDEMNELPPNYQVEGQFEELGVGGVQLFDISAAYQFDFAGHDLTRRTLDNTRLISDATRDLSLFGPWGIVGMPAMTERYTTLDFTGWLTFDLDNLLMKTSFPAALPAPAGPRYTLSVDNRVSFSPDDHIVSGNHPPIWADLPFFEAQLANNDLLSSGNFLFDTGAQVSILSRRMAFELGLDTNLDGELDELDASFARTESVGGVGGVTTVPVFQIDQVHLPTDQGPDLVWTGLQWLILDIADSIDGVFGFDNLTSGWAENLFTPGQAGYIMKTHFDFQGWDATGQGKIHFDLNPDLNAIVNPSGPGAVLIESGGSTLVSESGHTDTYTIRLSQPPAANVSVSLVPSSNVSAGLASQPSITVIQFTPANWNVPQTIRVAGIDDNVEQSLHRGSVRHISSSSDPSYHNVGMPRVVVDVVDNDFAGLMIIRSGGATEVVEAGITDTYQLVLTKAPTQPVTVHLDHFANQLTAVNAANGASSVVFTASNWNVPQTVRVTAVDDLLVEGTQRAWVIHRIDGADLEYQQATALPESVTIADNDTSIPPRVTNVIIGSSQWNASMIDSIDGPDTGIGNGLGLSLVGNQQLTNLSWVNVDRIHVVFSQNVGATFNANHVKLVGSNVLNYMPQATLSFGEYGWNVGTIKLSTPLAADSLILALSDGIKNAEMISLDGEWFDSVSTQSGNGSAGGQFNFRINALPGDVNSDAKVMMSDMTSIRMNLALNPASLLQARRDVDGNWMVNQLDIAATRLRVGTQTPPAPQIPVFGVGGGASGMGGSLGGVWTVLASSDTPRFLAFEADSQNRHQLPSVIEFLPQPTGGRLYRATVDRSLWQDSWIRSGVESVGFGFTSQRPPTLNPLTMRAETAGHALLDDLTDGRLVDNDETARLDALRRDLALLRLGVADSGYPN